MKAITSPIKPPSCLILRHNYINNVYDALIILHHTPIELTPVLKKFFSFTISKPIHYFYSKTISLTCISVFLAFHKKDRKTSLN